ALADARKDGVTAVRLRDVVDELHDDDRFTDAGAAEEAYLSPLYVRSAEIDDLDAGLEQLLLRRLIFELRCRTVNRPVVGSVHRSHLVDRFSDDVHDSA